MKPYNGFSPETRRRAQAWLNTEWTAGRLARPVQCCACGQDQGIIDAHAEDYSEPFRAGVTDAFHLCFTCHMVLHCRFRSPRAWDAYREMVRHGARFPAVDRREFGVIVKLLAELNAGIMPVVSWGDAQQSTPLDDIHTKALR